MARLVLKLPFRIDHVDHIGFSGFPKGFFISVDLIRAKLQTANRIMSNKEIKGRNVNTIFSPQLQGCTIKLFFLIPGRNI